MKLEDNDYLSIFDIELRKAQKHFSEIKKNFIIKVCRKTLNILETSPNFLIINDKKGLKYLYRNQYEVVLDELNQRWHEFFSRCREIGKGTFTRLDCALDDKKEIISIPKFADKWRKGYLKTDFKVVKVIMNV